MTTAIVLGATGIHGSRVVAELLRTPGIKDVVAAGRSADRLDALKSRFGTAQRLGTKVVDVTNHKELADAMAGADVTLSCVGPGYLLEQPCVDGAVAAGARYISLCNDYKAVDDVQKLDDQARRGHAVVVSGCGFSPGLTSLLAELASAQFERITEIEIATAVASVESPGEAAALHLLNMLAEQAGFISEGSPAATRAGSAPKPVYFPEPVGWVETYRFGHPEISTLEARHPDLETLSFRFGLTERAVMDVTRAIGAAGLAKDERYRRISLRASKPFLPLLQRIPPRSPVWSAARVDVHGRRDGRYETVSLGIADHLGNMTAAALVRGALTLKRLKPGVHAPEGAFNAKEFFHELSLRGIRPARLEPYPV
jgi:saccharopine dehydrogenase-like NADP-dependent oxidoreductase